VQRKSPNFFRGEKMLAGTHVMFRFWPEGWMQGTVLGRAAKRGCNYRVEYTDGETLDQQLFEEKYAWGEQPPNRVGIWCLLKKA